MEGTSTCVTVYVHYSVPSGPIPSVLHLSFKAQRLYNHSSVVPPLSVINQLCSTASQALKICKQDISSEDTMNLVGPHTLI